MVLACLAASSLKVTTGNDTLLKSFCHLPGIHPLFPPHLHKTLLTVDSSLTQKQHLEHANRVAAISSSRLLLGDGNGSAAASPSPDPASPGSPPQKPSAHKPLWPLSSWDIGVFVVAGATLFIAAGAGVGGGPVLVPVYLLLGHFGQAVGVALSNTTIFGGSIANVLCNIHKRHPFRDRPLVDWDLILLMEPPTVLGAVVGSFLNKLLPVWINRVLLAMFIILMTWRVSQRAMVIYRRETLAKMHEAATAAGAAASHHGSRCQEEQQCEDTRQGTNGMQPQPVDDDADGCKAATASQQPRAAAGVDEDANEHGVHEGHQTVASKLHSHSSTGNCSGMQHGLSDAHSATATRDDCAAAAPAAEQSVAMLSDGSKHGVTVTAARLPSSVLLNIELEGNQSAEDFAHVAPSAAESKLAYAPAHARSTCVNDDDDNNTGPADTQCLPGKQADPSAPEVAMCHQQGRLQRIMHDESRQLPPMHLCMIVLVFIAMLLTSLFSKHHVACSSWQYWVIQASTAPVLLAIWLGARQYVLWKMGVKVAAQVNMDGELKWNRVNSLVFPLICSLAGLIAGMFGLGGAVVMTPLMLELGVQPQVSGA
eukprot:jgi/Chrzof1/9242/UNPLg00209.t1